MLNSKRKTSAQEDFAYLICGIVLVTVTLPIVLADCAKEKFWDLVGKITLEGWPAKEGR